MEDDYNRPRELAKKERLYHESKLQDKPFSQRVKPQGEFNTTEAVYGEDVAIPHKKPAPKRKPGIEHE